MLRFVGLQRVGQDCAAELNSTERLLCPWGFPGKSTGVGCHFFLQGIFLTQGSNPGLLHCRQTLYPLSHQGSPKVVLVVKKNLLAGDVRDTGLIPGLGRSPGGGHGNLLQYSCLENPMDRGAWRATVPGVTESDTTEATSQARKDASGWPKKTLLGLPIRWSGKP